MNFDIEISRVDNSISSIIRQFFSFQNNPKDLSPSYRMDLDLLNCLRRVKLIL